MKKRTPSKPCRCFKRLMCNFEGQFLTLYSDYFSFRPVLGLRPSQTPSAQFHSCYKSPLAYCLTSFGKKKVLHLKSERTFLLKPVR